jgi:predicted dienelactone hydrolase
MFGDDHLPLAPSALRRPQDIKDSFEWLLAQSQDQASDLYGCVDADQGYAVVGHSFGGYTALVLGGAAVVRTDVEERCAAGWKVACGVRDLWPTGGPTPDRLSLADDRVWAAIVLAPWDGDVLGSGLAEVAIPVTVIGAELDTVTPWDSVVRPIYDQLPEGNRYLAEILKSGHGSFIGVCSLAGELEGCGAGYRPADEVNEFTQTATVNFFDVVRGVSGAEAYWPPAYRDVNWQ